MEKRKIVIDKTHKNHTLKHDGLKSIFYIKNDLVVTDFGEKNKANIRYVINAKTKEVTPFPGENERIAKIDEVQDNTIKFLSSVMPQKASVDANRPDNYNNGCRVDLLKIKDKLERQFFGKSFNDTIHVQIAYNLLDVQKILALHVDNVINSITALSKSKYDTVGMMNVVFPYDDFFKKEKGFVIQLTERLMPYNRYFDNILDWYPIKQEETEQKQNKNSKEFAEKFTEKEIELRQRKNFYIIQILSYLRQTSVHALVKTEKKENDGDVPQFKDLFNPDKMEFDKGGNLNRQVVADKIFQDAVDNLMAQFKENSQKNLYILSQIFPQEKELVKKYIDFKFSDNNIKNLGINLKKIREGVIKQLEQSDSSMKIEPSMKQKVNLFMDFWLWNYYQNTKPENKNGLIVALRTSCSSEAKEKIYEEEIKRLGRSKRKELTPIVDKVKSNIEKKELKYPIEEEILKNGISERCRNVSYFAKYLFVMSKFMEKKEINELLTSLVNKFSNIESLIQTAKETNCWEGGFIEKYEPLNNLDSDDNTSFEEDFRFVLNLSLLKKNLKKQNNTGKADDGTTVKMRVMKDAIKVFSNKTMSEEELKKIYEQVNNKENKIRNFFISSVVNNRRFVYLLKNINPEFCSQIIKNEQIVKFILNNEEMPLSIIQSYYTKIVESKEPLKGENAKELMVNEIYKGLSKVSLSTFDEQAKLIKKDAHCVKNENSEAVKNKELITLYLTVCYLFVKGLVHTNSVYMLAFNAWERDCNYKYGEISESPDYLCLSRDKEEEYKKYLEEHKDLENSKPYRKKRHNHENIKNDLAECVRILEEDKRVYYDDKIKEDKKCSIIKEIRNWVEHCNVINDIFSAEPNLISKIQMNCKEENGHVYMNSYFGIYNYVLQKLFDEKYSKGNSIFPVGYDYRKKSLEKGHYDKNLLKALNMPFAYNLARYKNLTIEDLFNDRYPLPSDKEETGNGV